MTSSCMWYLSFIYHWCLTASPAQMVQLSLLLGVYPGVKASQVFLCSVAIVREEEEEEDTCVRYLCVMLGSSS